MKRPWMCCVSVVWKPRTATAGGWRATVSWTAGPFMKDGMLDGMIVNRYPTGLRNAIDQVLEMAEQFGITVQENMDMYLHAEGDGDDPDVQLPEGWKGKLRREAARRGWECYAVEETEETFNTDGKDGENGESPRAD